MRVRLLHAGDVKTRITVIASGFWVLLVAGSLSWGWHQIGRTTITLATTEGRLPLLLSHVLIGILGLVGLWAGSLSLRGTDTALRASESLLRESQRVARLGHYVLDVKAGRWTSSETLDDVFGIGRDFPRTVDSWLEIIHPDERAEMREYFAQHVMAGQRPFDREYRVVRVADGAVRWVHGLGQLELSAGGPPLRMFGTIQDITDRKRTEEQYQTLFQKMLDGFALHEIVCDAQGTPVDYRFLAVNPAFERLTGLEAADVVGRTVLEVLPGIEAKWIETYGRVALTGEPAHFGSYARDLGRHFEVTAFRPGPKQFACIFVDVSERKRAEEALRASEERFRLMFEKGEFGITLADPQFRFVSANPAFCRMIGYTPDELARMTFADITPPNRLDGDKANVMAMARGEISYYSTEKQYLRKDGGLVWGSLITTPIHDSEGRIAWYLAMVHDITERKLAEQERERLQEQLLQAMKMESVGRLAGGVAHDFNNMLQTILGTLEMVLTNPSLGDRVREDLEEVQRAAQRTANLNRQLLAFARKQTVAPKVVNLNEAVGGILKMLRRLIGEEIELIWTPGGGLWQVKIDPVQIDQILTNLCLNARDAIDGVGNVAIETGNVVVDDGTATDHPSVSPGQYVMLVVSDDGTGMDSEALGHLFEPFFTTKALGQGTGLGMATVYGIVRQNEGFIHAESQPGEGTTIRIYLPRCAGAVEFVAAGPAREWPKGRGETVLLVEDEPQILRLAQTMLEHLGYVVLPAGAPSEALRLAQSHSGEIHLLITDVVMPEMNGRALADRIAAHRRGIKCLFVSGYTADVISHRGVLDEGLHFMQKPFTIKDLAARLREALDSD